MIQLVYDLNELSYNYRQKYHQEPTDAFVTAAQWKNFVQEYGAIGIARNEMRAMGLEIEIGTGFYVWRK